MNSTISDFHALHVLSADIQDEIYAGKELFSRLIVSHGLDDALVHVKAGLDQTFAIACNCGP